MDNWINIKDRLPEENKICLCFSDKNIIHILQYFGINNIWCYSGIPNYAAFYNITHWMPLPDPPEPDNG